MNREKLYELVKEDVVKSSAYPSVIMNYLANIEPPIDFRLGGAVSECFDENEELSPLGSEVKYFARVVEILYYLKGELLSIFLVSLSWLVVMKVLTHLIMLIYVDLS